MPEESYEQEVETKLEFEKKVNNQLANLIKIGTSKDNLQRHSTSFTLNDEKANQNTEPDYNTFMFHKIIDGARHKVEIQTIESLDHTSRAAEFKLYDQNNRNPTTEQALARIWIRNTESHEVQVYLLSANGNWYTQDSVLDDLVDAKNNSENWELEFNVNDQVEEGDIPQVLQDIA